MIFDNKYVKKIYRVLPQLTEEGDLPRDLNGDVEESFDDYYIPCNRANAEIYTTSEVEDGKEIFVAYVPSRTIRGQLVKELKEFIIKETNNDKDAVSNVAPKGCDYESEFYFYDCDMKHFAKALNARTKGAKMHPTDKSNLPIYAKEIIPQNKYSKMPKGWFNEFKKNYAIPIQKKEGLKATLLWDSIYSNFGKDAKKNVVKLSEKENYKTCHYIHKIGLWEEFETYLKRRVEGEVK